MVAKHQTCCGFVLSLWSGGLCKWKVPVIRGPKPEPNDTGPATEEFPERQLALRLVFTTVSLAVFLRGSLLKLGIQPLLLKSVKSCQKLQKLRRTCRSLLSLAESVHSLKAFGCCLVSGAEPSIFFIASWC